jgi:Domain of unknown function (DUF4287)/Domain of unknown function (DUF5655)
MSFQAYLDTIKAKTGKTPDDFAKLAQEKSLTKHAEIVAWLKSDFALGHGHANAIVAVLLKSKTRKTSSDEKLEQLCAGKKAIWRETCDTLIAKLKAFDPNVDALANETYVNVLVGKKKFAILQPSSAERFDVGIKLKGFAPTDRLELAGSWNSMVTHRVRMTNPQQIDSELLAWLRAAYKAA